jgi:hypothetical protein
VTDVWVCGTCHSINRQRGSSCYKCGAPQSGAINALADVRTELAIQTRARVRYRSSILRAFTAAILIVAYAVLQVVVLFESLAVTQYMRNQIPDIMQGQLDSAEILRLSAPAVVPALLASITGIGALVLFGAWLSRVVMNVPALGGGTPNTTPTKAFIYPLIPFWNLFKTPPMIQDALYRLDPKAGGFFMILVAWIGLVGSAIIGFLAGWWVNLRIASVATSARSLGEAIAMVQGAIDMQILVDILTTLMSSFGAIVLVLIMFRIESRARARDSEIRKSAAAPRPEPGTVAARPGGVSWEMAAGTAAGQAGTAAGQAGTTTRPPIPPNPASDVPADAGATASSAAPESTGWVPGPLGFVPASTATDELEAPTTVRERPAAPARVPTGPRLHLRVESPDSMIATLDGESEAITLAELPETARALANADGSAVIATGAPGSGAATLAGEAFRIFASAGVPTTTGD